MKTTSFQNKTASTVAHKVNFSLSAMVCIALAFSASSLFAQTNTAWQSSGAADWGNAGSWSNGIPDTASDFVISPTALGTARVGGNYTFGGIGTGTTAANLTNNWTIQGLAGSNSLEMGVLNKSGSTLIITNGAGTLSVGITGNFTADGAMTLGSAGTPLESFTVGGTSTINSTINVNVTSTANFGILSMQSGSALQIANFTSPDTLRTVTSGGITGTAGIIRVANNIGAGGASHAHIMEANVASGSYSFSGALTNGLTAGSVLAFRKAGAGTQILGGNNTYTGATTISGGTLVLASSGSIASSSGIAVASGATFNVSAVSGYSLATGQTLSGSGTIIGNISIAGGTLAIGSSPGTMTFDNNLSFTSLSTANFEVNAFTAGNYDLAIGGMGAQSVTFAGTLNVAFQPGFATQGSVKIFDFESYSGNFSQTNFSGLATGFSASFDEITGTLTVIPEPGTPLLLGLSAVLFAILRRRRAHC